MACRQPLEQRFWSDVIPEPNTGCWLWMGADARDGYGKFFGARRHLRAHRAAWEFAHGPIPPGLYVCHRCDVRACCNPAHLFLGTHQDNMDDMARKGRAVRHLGEAHGMARLTEHDVREIRLRFASGEASQTELAARYGMHQSAMSLLINRKTWRHVQ